MKLLMIYCDSFGYTLGIKSLDEAPEIQEGLIINQVLAGFIQVEEKDEADFKSIERKLVNNLKWAARKNETKNIIIHSFAHLSDSKANPEFTRKLLDKTEGRLINAGLDVHQTPWGYFLNLQINAPGHSLARIFKDL